MISDVKKHEFMNILEKELPKAAASIDNKNMVSKDLLLSLRKSGVFDVRDVKMLMEAVRIAARSSPAVAHIILINGTAKLLLEEDYKEKIMAVSITEPGGGSDIKANLKTVAEVENGKVYISGVKIFTSNAIYADYFLVLALSNRGPTLYLLKRDENKMKIEPMDLTTMRGAGISKVHYNKVEAEKVVGKEGKGIKEALKAINVGRLGYAVIGLGIAEGLLRETLDYARNRIVFGRSIIEHQGPRWMLAEIYAEMETLRSYVEKILAKGVDIDPIEASIAKIMGARVAQRAAWISIQLQGGRGLAKGALGERLARDARALDIGEGAREVLLDFIGSRITF